MGDCVYSGCVLHSRARARLRGAVCGSEWETVYIVVVCYTGRAGARLRGGVWGSEWETVYIVVVYYTGRAGARLRGAVCGSKQGRRPTRQRHGRWSALRLGHSFTDSSLPTTLYVQT